MKLCALKIDLCVTTKHGREVKRCKSFKHLTINACSENLKVLILKFSNNVLCLYRANERLSKCILLQFLYLQLRQKSTTTNKNLPLFSPWIVKIKNYQFNIAAKESYIHQGNIASISKWSYLIVIH